MKNFLIIKINAAGDVLRTSVLLHVLQGQVCWITAAYNIPLFPDKYPGLTLIPVENIPPELFTTTFDTVINLEEDAQLARLISTVSCRKTIGVLWKNGKLEYSSDAAEWLDMSLISKLPRGQADELKAKNTYCYQELLYRMVGKPFAGEEYIIYKNNLSARTNEITIGIEKRVGSTWPNKSWGGYDELIEKLSPKYRLQVFEQRDELRQYMEDIDSCTLVISGDTLAMHIAIGYQIPCIAIFNCTSPSEIYEYGILTKIVSPLLLSAFYNRERRSEIINSVPVAEVYKQVEKQIVCID
jgi:heptosyltransferase-2